MKLITKTIFYYLLISLPLLIIAGICGYYLINKELRDGTDEALWKEKINAEKQVQSLSETKTIYLSYDSLSTIIPVSFSNTGYFFSDTVIYDRYEEENLNYRVLKQYYTSNNQNYLITVAKPTLEDDELKEGLLSAFVLIIGFLLAAFFIVNWLLSKTLWKPFYKTIYQLNTYDIKNHTLTNFESSSTKEFQQLNETINQMTEKINHDFIQQKEFTENASHEMQTPLAIIKANISLLLQSPNIKEAEMNQLQAIDNTTKKLAALNKALLLLSKIENQQFKDDTQINLAHTINKVLVNYEAVIESKNITFHKEMDELTVLTCNQSLLDILITNLIQNAIRHNRENGDIIISTQLDSLTIANTGAPLAINESDLFIRFKKNENSHESLGLGLSIVQSIAKLYHYNINYSYINNLHTFTLNF